MSNYLNELEFLGEVTARKTDDDILQYRDERGAARAPVIDIYTLEDMEELRISEGWG